MTVEQHSKVPDMDLEMQKSSHDLIDETAEKNVSDRLQDLFGCSQDDLLLVPGAEAWCRYVECSFEPLLGEDYTSLWNTIGAPRPTHVSQCWPWWLVVVRSMLHSTDAGTSIEDILDQVMSPSVEESEAHPDESNRAACLIGIFAVLCWCSMTVQPQLRCTPGPCLSVIRPGPSRGGLKMDFAQRPITAVFRNLQRSIPTSRWRPAICESVDDASTDLYVSTLNYESLRTIGKIRLKWVDCMGDHLEFDSRNRTLSIFRFPSFCALIILGSHRILALEDVAQGFYSTDPDAARDSDCRLQLSREVLMSYRLIFGQTRTSRKFVKASLRQLVTDKPDTYDKLLNMVCGEPCKKIMGLPSSFWPVSCRDYHDVLQEEPTYSAHDDFPMLSRRLEAIQEFNSRQQPSRLRDLWRDRRNPLQWYTFWAVLIVGGASIVLALLQLIVAIAAIPLNNTP